MDELALRLRAPIPLELRLRNDTHLDQASGRAWSGKHPARVLSAGVRTVRLAPATRCCRARCLVMVFRSGGAWPPQRIRAAGCPRAVG